MVDCYCNSKNLYSSSQKETNIFRTDSNIQLTNERKPLKVFERSKMTIEQLSEQAKIEALLSKSLPPEIQTIEYTTITSNPQNFLHQFVNKNIPVIIKNALNSWPALQKWKDPEYLSQTLGSQPITIDLTTDGYADSIKEEYLIQPYQITSPLSHFLSLNHNHNQSSPPLTSYIQK
jgi:hypothetical protein